MAATKKAVAIRLRAEEAVRMLTADSILGVAGAARDVGVCESTVRRYWNRVHDGPPRRGKESLLALCAVMRDHVCRHEQTAAEIFAAVRDDYGTCCERRLWRALSRLLAGGVVVRRGVLRRGCVYLRVVRLRA